MMMISGPKSKSEGRSSKVYIWLLASIALSGLAMWLLLWRPIVRLPDELDLGEMEVGSLVPFSLKICNAGFLPVRIQSAATSCGCVMLRERTSIPSLVAGESYELRGMISAPGYEGPVSQKVSVKINDAVRYVQIKGRTVMRIGFSPDSVLFERTEPPASIHHVMVTVPERNQPLTEVSVRSPVSFVKTTAEIVNGVGMISICLAAAPPSGELDIPLQVHVTGRSLHASKVLRVGGYLNDGYSFDNEAIILKSTGGPGTVRVSVNPPLSPDKHLAFFQTGDAWTTAEVHIDQAGGIVLNYSNIADSALFEQGWILVRHKSDERYLIFLPVYLAVQPINPHSGS